MKQITFLLFVFLLFCQHSFSQEKIWTLDECMKYAVENSHRANKQIARNSIIEQDYKEAIGNLLPSLNAGSGINFNFGRQLDPETNNYNNINSFSNSYSVYSSVTLFNGFSRINNLRMQKINKLRGKEELKEIRDMIAYETMEAYLNVLYVKEIYNLAELQLIESRKNLEQVKKMEQLGIKGSADVAEIIAKEAADNYNFTQQKNLLTIAIIKLKEKMNYPFGSDINISEHETLQLIKKTSETASDVYEKALSSYSKILSAEYSLKSSTLAYNISKGYIFPRLDLETGFSTGFSRYMDENTPYDPFKEQLKNRQGYYIGFSLSVPILNGFYYSANIKRNKQNSMIAQYEHDEVLYSIYAEIEQAVADLNGQADAFAQAKKQVDAMFLAHSANQKKYTEGLISAIELTTSANRLLAAQIEEINAKYIYIIKYKLVEHYKGETFLN
jgi:outer membrane protein